MRRASSCEELSCSEERRGVTGAEGEGADAYLPRAMLNRLLSFLPVARFCSTISDSGIICFFFFF